MTFIDFTEIKERINVDDAISFLGLQMRQVGPVQWRGPCPRCSEGGERALVLTRGKGFYCWASKKCGDVIALVAHIRGSGMKEAAAEIAAHFGTVQSRRDSNSPRGTVPQGATGKDKATPQPTRVLTPLSYLQATHEAVQALGVSPGTCERFGAGLAAKGIMAQVGGARLAIPIHDRSGQLIAYCGRAVAEKQQPALIFPNGFDPTSVIFGAHRVQAGELYLVRDPLQVLLAYENGIENVVAFLTEAIAAGQLEQLASLMDEHKCETVALY